MSIPSLSCSSSPADETKSRQTDHLPQAPGMVFESSYCYIVQCPNPPPVTVLQCQAPRLIFQRTILFNSRDSFARPTAAREATGHNESEHDNSDFLFRIVSVMKSIQIENNHHIH